MSKSLTICPHCGEPMSGLDFKCLEYQEGFYQGKDQGYDFTGGTIVPGTTVFLCSECEKPITNDEEEANKIIEAIDKYS